LFARPHGCGPPGQSKWATKMKRTNGNPRIMIKRIPLRLLRYCFFFFFLFRGRAFPPKWVPRPPLLPGFPPPVTLACRAPPPPPRETFPPPFPGAAREQKTCRSVGTLGFPRIPEKARPNPRVVCFFFVLRGFFLPAPDPAANFGPVFFPFSEPRKGGRRVLFAKTSPRPRVFFFLGRRSFCPKKKQNKPSTLQR